MFWIQIRFLLKHTILYTKLYFFVKQTYVFNSLLNQKKTIWEKKEIFFKNPIQLYCSQVDVDDIGPMPEVSHLYEKYDSFSN